MKARRGQWEEEREQERLLPFLSSHRSNACLPFFKLLSFYRNITKREPTPQICLPQCDVALSPWEISEMSSTFEAGSKAFSNKNFEDLSRI